MGVLKLLTYFALGHCSAVCAYHQGSPRQRCRCSRSSGRQYLTLRSSFLGRTLVLWCPAVGETNYKYHTSQLKNYDTHQKGHISVDMHSLRCTMLLCCCGVSEVANLLRSGSLLRCVCLPPGITAAEMPLLSFVRPSVFDITIVLPWSYSGSLVPSCWGNQLQVSYFVTEKLRNT